MSHDSTKDVSCLTLALKNPSILHTHALRTRSLPPLLFCPLSQHLGYATRGQGQRELSSGFGLRLLLGLDLCGKKEQDPPLHGLLVIESLSTEDTSPILGGSPHYPSATREGSPQYSCELNMQPNELILLVCKRIENSLSK